MSLSLCNHEFSRKFKTHLMSSNFNTVLLVTLKISQNGINLSFKELILYVLSLQSYLLLHSFNHIVYKILPL